MNIVKKIHVGLNINVAENIHLTRMERNLMTMIDMTKDGGVNDCKKIKPMQKTLATNYQYLEAVFCKLSSWSIKDKYILSPVIELYGLSNTLWSPKVNIYS